VLVLAFVHRSLEKLACPVVVLDGLHQLAQQSFLQSPSGGVRRSAPAAPSQPVECRGASSEKRRAIHELAPEHCGCNEVGPMLILVSS